MGFLSHMPVILLWNRKIALALNMITHERSLPIHGAKLISWLFVGAEGSEAAG